MAIANDADRKAVKGEWLGICAMAFLCSTWITNDSLSFAERV